MEELNELISGLIKGEELILAVLSNLRSRQKISYSKVDVEPVLIQGELKYQFTYEYENKVNHKNLNIEESLEELDYLCQEKFRQLMLFTEKADYQVLISKKRKVKIIEQEATREKGDLSHNRQKEYILENNKKHDFLIRLGVMNKEGKVIPTRYDKFRQINRFLELVEDVIPAIEKEETINIIDFGCGKSYLTFGLYYYFVEILKLDVNIIGLDLKEDVINFCNQVAEDLNYEKLKFIHGDIADFKGTGDVDMVVTLHACDTATDAALVKAIGWNAKAILSVPCCQHELYNKIDSGVLEPMLKHGIIKERLASLVTDSLRGNILEIMDYEVQLVEFIDMEHTHKNILIRAIKANNIDKNISRSKYKDLKEFWKLEDLFIEEELKSIGIEI